MKASGANGKREMKAGLWRWYPKLAFLTYSPMSAASKPHSISQPIWKHDPLRLIFKSPFTGKHAFKNQPVKMTVHAVLASQQIRSSYANESDHIMPGCNDWTLVTLSAGDRSDCRDWALQGNQFEFETRANDSPFEAISHVSLFSRS